MLKKILIILFFICLTLNACQWLGIGEGANKGKLLAQVGNAKLYLGDMKGIIPTGTSKDDSTEIASNYRQTWIRRQLLVQKASTSTQIDEKEINRKLQEYRYDLLVYGLEKEYISKKLDTSISKKEIEEYYTKNTANFELKQNIVKARLIKIARDTTKTNILRSLLNVRNKKETSKLREHCVKYAPYYHLADSIWVDFDALVRQTPFKQIVNKTDFIQQNPVAENSDKDFNYYLVILEYKLSNQVSPLEFAKERIINMLTNQRKVKLIKEMERQVFEMGKKEKAFEIFD